MSPVEIELKLLFAPAGLRRLPALPAVAERTVHAHGWRQLRSVYFDTADFRLREAGLALRLRREGGRWIQSLKGRGEVLGGLHRREEYESILGARSARLPAPDRAALNETPYATLLRKKRVREGLNPVFETRFRRRELSLLLAGGTEVTLALDLGEIVAGTDGQGNGGAHGGRSGDQPVRQPICEAELELVRGDPAAVLRFALELAEVIDFRIGHASKAERAWQMALGLPMRPRKAWMPPLREEMDARPAWIAVVSTCLEQMAANEAGVIDGRDPEFLHQFRVGMRRLRVALALERDPARRRELERLRPELRWLGSMLGPARNWDVFATELLPPIARYCGAGHFASLRARAAARRRRFGQDAREALQTRRQTRLWIRLALLVLEEATPAGRGRLPEGAADPMAIPAAGEGGQAAGAVATAVVATRPPEDARAFAAKALARRRTRLLTLAPRGEHPAAESLHRLRIEAKKLRYTAEFFASLWGEKRVRRFTEALAGLQDTLGAVNDAAVSQRMLDEISGGRRPLEPRMHGLAQGWIASGEARARAKLARAWETFIEAAPFW